MTLAASGEWSSGRSVLGGLTAVEYEDVYEELADRRTRLDP
jgi:hypothetical protein